MRVFISWAGDKSKAYAEAFRKWLPGVLQSVAPYFTPADIEKGARWFTEISKEVEASSIGLFCVTSDALTSTWMAFEAGAISKFVEKSKVCPILFDVEVADVKGPLANFQATPFSKVEVKHLVETINGAAGEAKLPSNTLESVFEKWWPDLEGEVERVRKETIGGAKKSGKQRPDREILEEILLLLRRTTFDGPARYRVSDPTFERMFMELQDAYLRIRAGSPKDVDRAMGNLGRIIDYMEHAIMRGRESREPPIYDFARDLAGLSASPSTKPDVAPDDFLVKPE